MSLFITENSWRSLAERIQVKSGTVAEIWVGQGDKCVKVYPEGVADAWWYITGTSPNYTFHICSQGSIPSSVVASGQVIDYGTRPGNRPYHTYRTGITSVVVDEAVSLNYASQLFYGFSNATTFTDLYKLDTSTVTSMEEMFGHCSSVTALDVTHFNTSNVVNMRAVFEGCTLLASLDVTHFNTANVTDMFMLFDSCAALTSIDVSHFVTTNVTNMGDMFYGCSSLTSLDLRNFNTANVTSMSYMFRDCTSLTTLYVTSFDTTKVRGMEDMFYNCSSLTTLDISSFSNVLGPLINRMFFYCTALGTIYADAAKWTQPSVGQYVFYQNDVLVGGNGTVYDSNYRTGYYACVDTANTPGYFTQKVV